MLFSDGGISCYNCRGNFDSGRNRIMPNRRKLIAAGYGCLGALVIVAFGFWNLSDIGHQAIRLHLELVGSSIYDYHSRTGQWPARIDDLGATSLPQKSPYWKQLLEEETIVVLWPKKLQPDSKNNSGVILAYHNKGLLVQLGRIWICRGDLRTEYIPTEELQAYLQANKE